MPISHLLRAGLAAGALIGTVACGATGQATQSASASSTTFAEEFPWPVTVSVPEGWVAYETGEAVVIASPAVGDVSAERMVMFRTEGGAPAVEVLAGFETSGIEEGRPIAQPWPEDFGAWLAEREMFEVLEQGEATIAGSAATVFDARSDYEPPAGREDMTSLRVILVGAPEDGTDVSVRTGEMRWRFVLFDDRPLAIAYGASVDDFSEAQYMQIVESLSIDEPEP